MSRIQKSLKIMVVAVSAGVAAGCASQPDYGCDIPKACAPVYDNYDHAVSDESRDGWVSEGTDPGLPPGVEPENESDSGSNEKSDDGWFSGWFGSHEDEKKIVPVVAGERDVHGGPVYVPPRPHRIWLAHWKGKAGELNSGNYTYLTTPGYYIYMGDRYLALPYGVQGSGSSASGLSGIPRATFTPVRPDQLGFQAEESDVQPGVLDNMVQPNTGGE